MWLQRKLFDLAYSINLLGNEGTTFTNGAEKAVKWKAEMEGLKARATTNLAKYPQLVQSLDKYWNPPRRAATATTAAAAAAGRQGSTLPQPAAAQPAEAGFSVERPLHERGVRGGAVRRRVRPHATPSLPTSPAKSGTCRCSRPATSRRQGRSCRAGSRRCSPRSDDTTFKQRLRPPRAGGSHLHRRAGAGRARDGEPRVGLALRARGWWRHASDFGTQGDKPTHPELLDDLAARFIEHGWSLKWLNKEIMMSAAYRQSSQPRADGLQADEANALLWRQNPRRLDAEAYRDTLTRSAGLLDLHDGRPPGRPGRRRLLPARDLRARQPRAPRADAGVVRLPRSRRNRPLAATSPRRRCSRFS